MISLILALIVATVPPSAEPVTQLPGDQYAETWEWCIDRFPGKPEMQEACQWGAYEMLPAIPTTTEWSA